MSQEHYNLANYVRGQRDRYNILGKRIKVNGKTITVLDRGKSEVAHVGTEKLKQIKLPQLSSNGHERTIFQAEDKATHPRQEPVWEQAAD